MVHRLTAVANLEADPTGLPCAHSVAVERDRRTVLGLSGGLRLRQRLRAEPAADVDVRAKRALFPVAGEVGEDPVDAAFGQVHASVPRAV